MHKELWTQVLEKLESEMLPLNVSMWIKPLKSVSLENNELTLFAPSETVLRFFENNYRIKVENILQTISGHKISVKLTADTDTSTGIPGNSDEEDIPAPASEKLNPTDSESRKQRKNNQTFENFVVGKENSFAFHAAHQIIENPAKWNPLYLYGPSGTGKSHLLKAIAWKFHEKGLKTLYLRGFEFYNLYLNSVLHKDYESFYSKFLNLDVLILDEFDFLEGKDKTGDTFLHIFNTLYDAGSQIILCSQKSPENIEGFNQSLRSRLTWGLLIPVETPGKNIRSGIIDKLQDELESKALSDELALYISKIKIENIRHLEGAVRRLIALHEITGKELTKEIADEEIFRLLPDKQSKITPIEVIRQKICEHYNLTPDELDGTERSIRIARPRQVAMYLAKKHTGFSYPAIGSSFGNKKHSTVINACKKVEQLKNSDSSFKKEIEQLEFELDDVE